MNKGSITILFSLILTLVLVLTLTLAESVRTAGLKLTVREAGDAAMDSVFAGYDRGLLDEYGLLFYDGGMGQGLIQYEEIEKEYKEYFEENTRAGLKLIGGSFFPADEAEADITEVISAVDYNGNVFIRSVLDYYRFAGAADLLAELQKNTEAFEGGEEQWKKILKGEKVPSYEELFGEEAGGEESGNKEFSKDERKQYEKNLEESPIGSRKAREKKGWLGLVLPKDRSLSGKKTNRLNFPSTCERDEREFSRENMVMQGTEKVIFDEYLLEYFPDFLTPGAGDLEYELEYLLYGRKTDEENLKTTLNRLLWLREGMNLLCILSSPQFMQETQEMALVLVGWTEIEALVPVVQTALVGAWSYAESLADLKILLKGGEVPAIKTEKNWNLSLSGVVGFLKGEETEMKELKGGLKYIDYLRILLFLTDEHELAYRAMDMIQMNRQREDPSFLMMSRIYAMEVRTSIQARPLFFRLPVFYKTSLKWMPKYQWDNFYTQTY